MTENGVHAGQANAEFYYTVDGNRVGPVTAHKIKELADDRTITPQTLIWKQGLKDWVPAGKVKGLFGEETAMALAKSDVLSAVERGKAMKKCPSCAEQINIDAKKCRYCGELIAAGNQIVCPSCKQSLAPGNVMCVTCGYDFRSGQRAAPPRSHQSRAGEKYCSECGAIINSKAEICPQCGVRQQRSSAFGSSSGTKNKWAAVVLALFLGGFGGHKFYLGAVGMGVVYLLFFWTGLPALAAFVEAILYAVMSEEDFARKYG